MTLLNLLDRGRSKHQRVIFSQSYERQISSLKPIGEKSKSDTIRFLIV